MPSAGLRENRFECANPGKYLALYKIEIMMPLQHACIDPHTSQAFISCTLAADQEDQV